MDKIEFLAYMLDKLNKIDDLDATIPDVFNDLCNYLDFGYGFIYRANHEKSFLLQHDYSRYAMAPLRESLWLHEYLTKEQIVQLSASRMIAFRQNNCDTPMEQGLSAMLYARSLLLIPITEEKQGLIGLIGIADRRGTSRTSEEDMTFGYAILSTLSNYIKTHIYYTQVESTRRAMEGIIENMGVDIYVNDFYTHELLFVNKSMAAPYGEVQDLLGRPCWEILYNDKTGECDFCPQKKLVDKDGHPTKTHSWEYQRPFDKSWFRVLSSAFTWSDGRLAHVVTSVDITENKRNEEIIRRMARYDSLTGLPNRYCLTEDCDEMLPLLADSQQEGYVIFIDLDGFKQVNDTLGHQAGDALLVKIGEMLNAFEYIHGRCYRYGGDEFVVLCYGDQTPHIHEILQYLLRSFATVIELQEGRAICRASIGVSHFPYDDNKTAGLMRKADHAMYFSKEQGEGQLHFYNQGEPCLLNDYRFPII